MFGLAAIAVPALPAGAASLHCGDTITSDLVLSKNLTCSGTALVVSVAAGSTVSIDLNGHRLKGDGTGTGIETVRPNGNAGTLSVSGGTITGFATALVGAGQGSLATLNVTGMRLVSNGGWLPIDLGPQTNVQDSSFIDSGLGGSSENRQWLIVRNSKFVRSGIHSSYQSFTFVYDSTFVGGGIYAGIESNLVVLRNSFQACDVGVSLNTGFSAGTTTVEDNTFSKCRIGAVLGGLDGPVSVQRNSFVNSTETGMMFTSAPGLNGDIAGNTFLHNGGDGLSGSGLTSSTGPLPIIRITGNQANRNGGYGLDLTGVTDGGGNTARGNANPAQCTGVVCTSH